MELRLSPWGNSLGLRIPKALSHMLDMRAGTKLSAAVEQGKLVLTPTPAVPHYSLEALCARITSGNTRQETDWGVAIGQEVIDDAW